MAKLVCTLDDRIIGEYALDKERLSIGRKKTNDIVIDNLAVSGVHAYVVTIGGDSFLEDANSTNGSFVNLKPVRKHVLSDGDVIEIGRHQFKYLKHETATASKASTSDNVSIPAGTTPLNKTPHTQPPSLKSLIQMSRPMKSEEEFKADITQAIEIKPGLTTAKLRILNGSNSGQEVPLIKTLTTLGKPGVQVVVITKRSNGYFLSQIEGAGAKVNDLPIVAPSYNLTHKDVLEISGIKMEFSFAQ